MPLKGVHLELLPRTSPEHTHYQEQLGSDTLVHLYKLVYAGTESWNLGSSKWSRVKYYHGTGHCGCLDVQVAKRHGDEDEQMEEEEEEYESECESNSELAEGEDKDYEEDEEDERGEEEGEDEEVVQEPVYVKVSEWCTEPTCATRGILTEGHQMRFIIHGEGHFFSSRVMVAKSYALSKTAQARRPIDDGSLYPLFVCKVRNALVLSYRYVLRDKDILPYYLAIVRTAAIPDTVTKSGWKESDRDED